MEHVRAFLAAAFVLTACGMGLLLSSCAERQPELIPREVLFGNPLKARPQISPDGTRLAYIAPVDDVLNVWVKTIGGDDDKPITKDAERGIYRYFWAADSKHIMYLQDKGGNENWRLYGVNLDTEQIRDLTPYDDVQVRIVDRDKHFPNELLIAMNKDDARLHDVYHLDLQSGRLKRVAKNPGDVTGWVTDTNFKVLGAMAATPDGGFELRVRSSERASWKKLLTWDSVDAMTSGPILFSKDGKSIYLQDSRDANAGRLVKMNLRTKKIDVIAEDPRYDVGGIMIHPDTYEIQAVTFVKARTEWLVLDQSIREDFSAIKQLHHGDFFISDRDNADDTWLVGFTADNGPVKYFAFDRETKTGTFLFDHKPDLNDYTLAPVEPVSFTSRDGLTIHGYITYPVGKTRTNLPLVLNVHGGPWARDTWGYNPEAQWLSNRGYVCLQINFRGSTGYGKEFLNAGDKEWGGNMHNDLVDGVEWAIDQGIADPEKVAIYGGSYGGYAALVGATFTPDLFCCSVAMCGPSNLITFIRAIPPYWSTYLALFHKRVGNPDTEEEFLLSRSPLSKIDEVRIPMLIAQGANDVRVVQAESEQFVDALKEKGIEHEYLLFEDEGHGFLKPENRLEFYAATEKFLAKHLGGRYEEGKETASSH
jgi:dipeptidyl aminopeptidase/acylaminoacyl peptidase